MRKENGAAAYLKSLSQTDKNYLTTYGRAVHSELFYLMGEAILTGFLPKKISTDSGKQNHNKELGLSFNRLRPDVRVSMGNNQEVVFDLTTRSQRGYAKKYNIPGVLHVQELFYKRGQDDQCCSVKEKVERGTRDNNLRGNQRFFR